MWSCELDLFLLYLKSLIHAHAYAEREIIRVLEYWICPLMPSTGMYLNLIPENRKV